MNARGVHLTRPVGHRGKKSPIVMERRRGASRIAHADVAQLVEHHLAKVRVAGSSPVIRSEERQSNCQSARWVGREARQRPAKPCTRVRIPYPPRYGRLAQRERASLTRKRSLVRSQYRPLENGRDIFVYAGAHQKWWAPALYSDHGLFIRTEAFRSSVIGRKLENPAFHRECDGSGAVTDAEFFEDPE